MKREVRSSLILLALGLSLAGSLDGASLKAGASKVEITPPTGLPMYGFASRKGGATAGAVTRRFLPPSWSRRKGRLT